MINIAHKKLQLNLILKVIFLFQSILVIIFSNTKSCSTCASNFRHYFSRKESLNNIIFTVPEDYYYYYCYYHSTYSQSIISSSLQVYVPSSSRLTKNIENMKINCCEIIWFPEGCFELADRTIKNI